MSHYWPGTRPINCSEKRPNQSSANNPFQSAPVPLFVTNYPNSPHVFAR